MQETRGVNKGMWWSKTFAFRGLLKCGQCGADITAQDKFKTLKKTGEVKRFVYYNCTRRKDPNCTEKYINEDKLCELMKDFIEENYATIKISDELRAKVDKHMYVTKTLLTHYDISRELNDPFVEYARYALISGTENEKTSLAAGMETKLQIKHGLLEFFAK